MAHTAKIIFILFVLLLLVLTGVYFLDVERFISPMPEQAVEDEMDEKEDAMVKEDLEPAPPEPEDPVVENVVDEEGNVIVGEPETGQAPDAEPSDTSIPADQNNDTAEEAPDEALEDKDNRTPEEEPEAQDQEPEQEPLQPSDFPEQQGNEGDYIPPEEEFAPQEVPVDERENVEDGDTEF